MPYIAPTRTSHPTGKGKKLDQKVPKNIKGDGPKLSAAEAGIGHIQLRSKFLK